MELIWFILLWAAVLMLVFAWPAWPYARVRGWGYGPSALAAAILVILLLLFWFGLIAFSLPWGRQ